MASGSDGRLQSNRACCELCAALVAMSSLKTRSLTRHDKADARTLIAAWLRDRAVELAAPLDDTAVTRLVDDPALREPLALVTWARELFRRMAGHSAGPAVLALWRMFAWLPTGSPRPGFQVTVDAVLAADAAAVTAIRALAP